MLELPSKVQVEEPLGTLMAFCAEEYAYYDGVSGGDPDSVEPVDVLVTVAVNSYITNAAQARGIHRGLAAACDPILGTIPEDADVLAYDQDLATTRQLLQAACSVPKVLIPVATKVLHRKRRALIPMLDSVLIDHYLKSLDQLNLRSATQDKQRAADVAVVALGAFRNDLRAAHGELARVCTSLSEAGYELTPLRALEVLLWVSLEPRGYYR